MIKGRRRRMARVTLMLCVWLAVSLLNGLPMNGLPTFLVVPALAQQGSDALVPQSEVRREIARATFVSAATLAAIQRQSDADLRRQRFEIEELRAEVEGLRTNGAAETAALEELRNTLARREAAFVAELAEKDRAFADEIATYRRAVEDIAATPEGLAALVRFNNGDEAGALAVLDRLRAVRDLAAARRIAKLALDARNRAVEGVTTADVILRYTEITRLDPEAFNDWIELARLHSEAGNLTSSFVSARFAEKKAKDDIDRSVALMVVGDVQSAQGDLPASLQSYRRSLDLLDQLALGDPVSAIWQHNKATSLRKIGQVLLAQGDLLGALQGFQRSLDVMDLLAKADPGNAEWQSDLAKSFFWVGYANETQGVLPEALLSYQRSVGIFERLAAANLGYTDWQWHLSSSLQKVGDIQLLQGDVPGALQSYQRSLGMLERLAAADPSNAAWQRDLSTSLLRVGDVQVALGDLSGALVSYQRGLAIMERLASADAGNAGWQRDVSVFLTKVGDLQVALGDLPGALVSYQRGLTIMERVASADPGNASWQRDVSVLLWRLQRFPEAGVTWSDIVGRMEAMLANGTLLSGDRQFLDHARAEAAKEGQ